MQTTTGQHEDGSKKGHSKVNWLNEYKKLNLPPLKRGAHNSPSAGLCAMEMIAFIERLPHSDSPACTCPVLAAYVRRLNDGMPDNERGKLMAILPRLVGTVSPDHKRARAEHFAWRATKVFAVRALRRAGIDTSAIESASTLSEGGKTCRAAYDAAAAADTADATAAAANAAYAAYAADAAAHAAANAADAAAHAAAADLGEWDLAIKVLLEAIEIGPSAGWSGRVAGRAKELAELCA